MSTERILFPQFRDEQSTSRYPFTDTSVLTETETGLSISNNVFLDAAFYPIGGGGSIYLNAVVITPLVFEFIVATTDPTVTIRGFYDWRSPPTNGVIDFYDAVGRPAGMVIVNVENMRQFNSWAQKTYSFGLRSAQFVATTFIPAKEPGVRALQSTAAHSLTGDAWLIGDAGVVVRAENEHTIRFDIVGIPLYRRYACADASAVLPPKRFVKTINGCPPDEFGNFTITATPAHPSLSANQKDVVLRVYPTANGVVVEALGGSV
jgi:hypothetical protein